jgi:DedD protein
MMAGRRAAALRHELRFGARELSVFVGVIVVICALTFLFGVLVGREMTPAPRPITRIDGIGPDGPAARLQSEFPIRMKPAKGEERLTFYKTLTAPNTADLPPIGKPKIEEHLVPSEPPRDEPAAASPLATPGAPAGVAAPAAPAPAAPPAPVLARRSAAPPTPPAAPKTRPATVVSRPASRPPAATTAAAATAEPQLWTIQVSSLRSRPLAEELRTRLASRGLDAYLVSSATEDGLVRYRVRVGAYASRVEAERVATDLRSERTLTPFVTPRTR